ncbi:flagellar biosynthetic protein FliS [Desulfobotulus alkaliphilus]|uniref:Flagellar biosynthetic protein FliS n=1 Tax=Desulfobotulus alkaliphilus TaxID=622671 RepID=A0A562RTF6_9BACT|nr:flagellar export chaperone FliS [Desulfobotulus alkaliphilus]TWI72379.1 flagellar biosynthetic protein FliS [Desulfobotulus alkaliphilus]
MSAATAYKTYQSNHFEGMDPRRLILMLYDGALRFLKGAREGALENNPQKRGENLGRAIAIISELQASLNPDMNDEATEFLRGLYGSILAELPTASISNNIKPIEQTERYITQLRKIWAEEVMALPATGTDAVRTTLNQQTEAKPVASPQEQAAKPPTTPQQAPAGYPPQQRPAAPPVPGYGGKGQAVRNYGRGFTA